MSEMYPTIDSYGHVESEEEVERVRTAVEWLNASETVGAWEENANLHSAADMRAEMAEDVHIAVIEPWEDHGDYETTTCTICGGELEREKEL